MCSEHSGHLGTGVIQPPGPPLEDGSSTAQRASTWHGARPLDIGKSQAHLQRPLFKLLLFFLPWALRLPSLPTELPVLPPSSSFHEVSKTSSPPTSSLPPLSSPPSSELTLIRPVPCVKRRSGRFACDIQVNPPNPLRG